MNKVLIINAHHPYPSSGGRLNAALVERAGDLLAAKGYEVRTTRVSDGYDIAEEAEKLGWADAIIVQGPVYWMGFPWSYKKYQDEVYGVLGGGKLYDGDGRHRDDPGLHYGSGGRAQAKKYMFSLTFNAPRAAFDDPEQYLFGGKGVDDLFFPSHMAFRFMGMQAMETFVCYDVLKNPEIENDFRRFERHLDTLFP
jgi:modulator of drug activity B